MTNPENEKIVNYLVVLDKPGRHFSSASDTRWGGLIRPAPGENKSKTKDGIRIALFGSWEFGYLVLETLKEYERRFPGIINLVGLVTDNPLNPDAKISLKKRVWNLVNLPFRVLDETFIIESGLSHGIPVYTGEIKVESFYKMLKQWNPDVVLVCVFGQIFNSFSINLPPYGIYNFHPADLTKHQGTGPAPYEDIVARDAETAVWSVHQVTTTIDGGHVIGLSPPVNVRTSTGKLPTDPIVVYQKMAEALTSLTIFLIDELSHRFIINNQSYIDYIDFESLFPKEVKKRLLLPVISETASDMLPMPDTSCFAYSNQNIDEL